jgi:hypothetical protein
MADLAMRAGEMSSSTDAKAKAERDARAAGEWADDLTVAIAFKEWEKATSLIEEGRRDLLSRLSPTDSRPCRQSKASLGTTVCSETATSALRVNLCPPFGTLPPL